MNSTFNLSITKPNSFKRPFAYFPSIASIFLLAITAIASIQGAQHGLAAETCDRIWLYGIGSAIFISFFNDNFNPYETITIEGDAEGIDFNSEESIFSQCQKLGTNKE